MKNLRLLRKQNNLTLSDMSNALGISMQVLSRYERNERQADYDTIIRIATFFNVSIDYLLGKNNIDLNQQKITDEEQEFLNAYRTLLPTYKKLIKQQMEIFTGNEITTKTH